MIDDELKAIKSILKIFDSMDDNARSRVIRYVLDVDRARKPSSVFGAIPGEQELFVEPVRFREQKLGEQDAD